MDPVFVAIRVQLHVHQISDGNDEHVFAKMAEPE
jgi:hypothetical protein